MSFAQRLVRLYEAANSRQPGISQDKAYVVRKDLQELLYQFDRTDTDLRSLLPKDGSKGILLIAKERKRQIEQEGCTAEHDRQHRSGELALAAACYATPGVVRKAWDMVARIWPWTLGWWKTTPNDRIRELQKAGALIAAEIDRLQRAGVE